MTAVIDAGTGVIRCRDGNHTIALTDRTEAASICAEVGVGLVPGRDVSGDEVLEIGHVAFL